MKANYSPELCTKLFEINLLNFDHSYDDWPAAAQKTILTTDQHSIGHLQSLDCTSGVDWCTRLVNWQLKIIFYAFYWDPLAYGVVWSPAAFSVAILWSRRKWFTRPSVSVKGYPACNEFLIPYVVVLKQPDFSERGHQYSIAYYGYTVML